MRHSHDNQRNEIRRLERPRPAKKETHVDYSATAKWKRKEKKGSRLHLFH